MSKNSIHVVFGTGPAGLAVTDALVASGQRVRVVNRSGRADVPEGVDVVGGDATDPVFSRHVCEGASVVYNCTNAPYDKWPEMFPPLQVGVLEGAAAAGAKLVSMENLYMYGPTGGKPMTEDLPYTATTRKGRVRAQMARDLLAAHKSGRVRVAIGRASDYFGPRVLLSALGNRVFPPALAGKAVQVLGDPDLPHTYSYVPDIGKALVILGERDEALGQVWHLPSPETVTTRECLNMIFEETGREPKIQVTPRLALRLMGLFNPQIRELIEMLHEWDEPFIMDHSKFTQAFGDALTPTPLREALRTTLDWYRALPQ